MSDAGLCDSCRHRRIVRSDRGSRFLFCQRSKEDSRFPRYPRLPVLACAGHEPAGTGRSSGSGDPPGGSGSPDPGERSGLPGSSGPAGPSEPAG